MKIKFISQYRKRGTGTLTFVFGVTGTPEQLAAYKTHKGDNYRELKEDEAGFVKGTPLFYSTRYMPEGKLMETADKKWVVDSSEQDKFINLVNQCGGNVELAKELIRQSAAQ